MAKTAIVDTVKRVMRGDRELRSLVLFFELLFRED